MQTKPAWITESFQIHVHLQTENMGNQFYGKHQSEIQNLARKR